MAESIIQKAGGGIGSDEVTAVKSQVLAGYTALTRDSNDEPVAGTMTDFTKAPNKIQNKRLANGRFEVAVDRGFHNCNWAEGSYEYMELAEVASVLGLTAAKLLKGQTVCGVAGTATSDANATAAFIYSGKTAYVNGQKVTGTFSVASVVSFSVAPYSTSQVIATWKNPSRGPYGYFIICAKKGSYPASTGDYEKRYVGAGTNSALNATNSAIVDGLEAGQLYYFTIFAEVKGTNGTSSIYHTSAGVKATCTPTAHGRAAFTSSGTWTVPAGVRSIRAFAVGGGGAGGPAYDISRSPGGRGGSGGFTKTLGWTGVTPLTQYSVVVGAGNQDSNSEGTGGASSFGTLVSAAGGFNGDKPGTGSGNPTGGSGGGAAGKNAGDSTANYGGRGGSDGGKGWGNGRYQNGTESDPMNSHRYGQGATTREFGSLSGTMYAGGGGGGNRMGSSGASAGGDGGGGNGGHTSVYPSTGRSGSGGGGGGARGTYTSSNFAGAGGGSGAVIIEW